MFYRTGAIFPTLKSSSSYVVKSIAVENVSSSTSRRKSSMRLRKVRWNIYQKIRLCDKDLKGVLGYYRSLIKRFLKRFSAKLKTREPGIWKEKLCKTVKDVNKFLKEKSIPNSTCEANIVKSKVLSQSKPEKKKNTQHAINVKIHPQQEGTYFTIMAEYMSKMDSALLMLSTILYLVRNEQKKLKNEPFEVPVVETIDCALKDGIEAANVHIVTIVAEDEASVKKTDIADAKEVAEADTLETAASVMEQVLILTRADYYTIPSTSQLSLDTEGHCLVTGFTVGREGYGSIHYPGTMNVANLNLDDTVFIGHKEVTVFPDDLNKPALGEGLNRPAQITLDKVWPLDKSSGDTIRSPDRLSNMSYEKKLKRANIRTGARFIEYRPETGSWAFNVDHFSKHGLDESDSDTEIVAVDMSKAPIDDKSAEKTATLVKQAVNAYGIEVTWSVCPQLRHFPVSECRRRCEWDVMARRNVDPSYNEIKSVDKPVDKDSEEYKQRIKKASNNFLASTGVVLNKTCQAGFYVGVAALGCKCDAGFPTGNSNSDPYWNLTKASQSRGDTK